MKIQPDKELVGRVETLMAIPSTSWVWAEGGYTAADRWIVGFENGASAFIKAATTDSTAKRLREDYYIYAHIEDDYLPAVLGWQDDGARPNSEHLVAMHRERFMEGARGNGVPEETARKIFSKVNGHYMFPESHSHAFAVTAYQAAWLKRYHPLVAESTTRGNTVMQFRRSQSGPIYRPPFWLSPTFLGRGRSRTGGGRRSTFSQQELAIRRRAV